MHSTDQNKKESYKCFTCLLLCPFLIILICYITLLFLVGQFFFAYYASNVFKRLSSVDAPYTAKEWEEYLTYLVIVVLLVIYLI